MPAASARTDSPTAISKKFASLGLVQDFDFVLHLPLRYEDETALHRIDSLYPGQMAQVEGIVRKAEVLIRGRRQLTATIDDGSGQLSLRWLHFYPSQIKAVEEGRLIRVRGEVRGGSFWGFEMVHPKVSRAGAPLSDRLTPVYPATEGLNQPLIRKAVNAALSRVRLDDTLPAAVQRKYQLAPFAESIQLLHNPPKQADTLALIEKTHPAWERIKFDELLAQQLAMSLARATRQSKKAYAMQGKGSGLAQRLLAQVGFTLTAAQERVCKEILADMQRTFPMQRLLQGDVGSGKTVVAAIAAAHAIDQGFQVAIMAPTEILAEQHFRKMSAWFEPLGISTGWLAGSLTPKKKQHAAALVADGTTQLVVGTQALIQQHVTFARLGLMVVDEQHRFGVGQRLSLARKGEQEAVAPHQLSMSATPIPRTLAMTFFADLDVSVIDTLPPGRTPVITKLFADSRRDELLAHVHEVIRQGRQVYWVCPLVEESEALQLQTATDTFNRLQQDLPQLRIGLLHGRLPTQEKTAIMSAFHGHELDLLVATTVIEVGVDVSNASLMIIEHAERFGLAQLHQLRGRVGRGKNESVCVLLYQAPLSSVATARLKAMYETQDGFEIARRDLEQRGPGEFLGLRQSGMALLRFADIDLDAPIAEQARDTAQWLQSTHPEAAAAHLQRWARQRADLLRI
ncbi:MAG: ATP-dependent DNA helicase RecG [Advenella sp.]